MCYVFQYSRACRCQFRKVFWEIYPKHIKDNLDWRAYRSLLIQEALQEFGAVFWADPETHFTSGYIRSLVSQAERVGIVSWPMVYATSTFTHPSTYEYFNTTQKLYRFHRMVNSAQLLIFNTKEIHRQLMYAWIKCTLHDSCISPPGSQASGCDLTHKPLYRYSGCHQYDISILNVVLGQVFNYKTPYIAIDNVFEVVTPTKHWYSL